MRFIFMLSGVMTYILLFVMATVAMFGDPSLSSLKGIPWAIDTSEHRLLLLIAVGVLCPAFTILAVPTFGQGRSSSK